VHNEPYRVLVFGCVVPLVIATFAVGGCRDSSRPAARRAAPTSPVNASAQAQVPELMNIVQCGFEAVSSSLSPAPQAKQMVTEFIDKVGELKDIAEAMEFVYGKNAYALTPDEQADTSS
jgi:hypothetical protein